MKFYAAHKLISDVDNKVTFYLDPDFKTDFMDQLVLDCKALATNEVKTTTSKVTHFLEIVWSTLLHIFFIFLYNKILSTNTNYGFSAGLATFSRHELLQT